MKTIIAFHKTFGKEIGRHSYIDDSHIRYDKIINKTDIKTITAMLGVLAEWKGETRVIIEYSKKRR